MFRPSPLPCAAAAVTLLLFLTPTEAAPPERKKKSPPDRADTVADRKPSPAPSPSPNPTPAVPDPSSPAIKAGPATSSLKGEELKGFDTQPEPVRRLLAAALDLTGRNLTYTYGSADPAAGGMDCSGTIYYILKSNGFSDVPRQANEQYTWVRKSGRFEAVLSKKASSFELDNLHPGDLLFWTGTYAVDRDPPVTHTMIYLGRRKSDGKPLMVGASDGRPYDGEKRNGVSVFDFKLPAAHSGDTADNRTAAAPDRSPNFVGYGPVPGLIERGPAVPPEPKPEPTPEPPRKREKASEPSKEKTRQRSPRT